MQKADRLQKHKNITDWINYKIMVKVEFFGLYRLDYGIAECEINADSIDELFCKLEKLNPKYSAKDLRDSIVIVNDVNIIKLRKYKTKLKDGDTVLIMSPASGG